MDYENYVELCEAVYFFNRISFYVDCKFPKLLNKEEIERTGLNESIYKAVIRILFVNKLLDYDGSSLVITDENKEQHQRILDIISKNQSSHYTEMFNKAVDASHFFFDSITELEYEIYSRCNFQVTYETGKEVAGYVNLADSRVLELGGNSGGLGTALVTRYKGCQYTIVDTRIPCMVGNEFKESNKLDITFIEGNVFKLKLSSGSFDYVIIMNLLHDFDDIKCLDVLNNCVKYCNRNTKFLIIEDILKSEFEPREVIMHGLRLSVECRGGKQRTEEELTNLFSNINYRLEKTIVLNNIHTMLVMGNL